MKVKLRLIKTGKKCFIIEQHYPNELYFWDEPQSPHLRGEFKSIDDAEAAIEMFSKFVNAVQCKNVICSYTITRDETK